MNGKNKENKKIITRTWVLSISIIILALITLSLTQVMAQGGTPPKISPPLEPSLAYHLKVVMDKIESDYPKMGMEITRRVEFYFYIADRIDSLMNIYCDNLIPFIYQRDVFEGNDIMGTTSILRAPVVLGILNLFIRILQPFYALAILITAMYLLFISASPIGRARAKSTLIKLIMGLGIITLTLPIMELFLEISHYFTAMFLSIPSADTISAPIDTEMFMVAKEFFIKYFLRITFFEIFIGLPFLTLLLLLPVGVLMVLAVRYFMIILLTIFFPFTILLYSFFATRRLGRTLLTQTLIWIFVPVIDALVLLVTWIAYNSTSFVPQLTSGTLLYVNAFITLCGFLMLMSAPLIALGLMSWLGSLGIISVLFFGPVATTMSYFEKETTIEGVEDVVKQEIEK